MWLYVYTIDRENFINAYLFCGSFIIMAAMHKHEFMFSLHMILGILMAILANLAPK